MKSTETTETNSNWVPNPAIQLYEAQAKPKSMLDKATDSIVSGLTTLDNTMLTLEHSTGLLADKASNLREDAIEERKEEKRDMKFDMLMKKASQRETLMQAYKGDEKLVNAMMEDLYKD